MQEHWTAALIDRNPSRRVQGSDHLQSASLWRIWDREIEEIARILHSAKTLRNADTPGASQLPPEILSRIFLEASVIDPPSRKKPLLAKLGTNRWQWDLGWIKASHVCQKWRQAALSDGSLWCKLDGRRLSWRWFDVMTERAKGTTAPLSVSIDWAQYGRMITPSAQWALHPEQTRRLRILTLFHDLNIDLEGDNNLVKRQLSAHDTRGPAPLLESLTVEHRWEFNVTLPAHFVATKTPRLRSLSLRNAIIHWDSPLFDNLTHLNISLCSASQSQHLPTRRDLLNFLSRATNLDTLLLHHTLRRIAPLPGESVPEEVVSLPLLTSISLMADVVDCIYILEHLITPPTAHRRIRNTRNQPPPTPLPPVSRWGATVAQIKAVGITLTPGSEDVRFEYWTDGQKSPALIPYQIPEDEPNFALIDSWNHRFVLPGTLTSPPLDLQNIREVYIDNGGKDAVLFWPVHTWTSIFQTATQVSQLVLSGTMTGIILSAMVPYSELEDGTGRPARMSVMFPSLKTFVLRGLLPGAVATTLTVCLAARRAEGFTLQILQIPETYRDATWLAELQQNVAKLDFAPV
ncbi:hypothetical protein FA95DRAFT_246762 [Auriscalpium vulgare]|uniref:Uncharacterized protein n=1 Tax=Auriscalpium vulgare TaxID=40419 RepID=A0ACB8RKJ2_9AGAM|nr:hypothetical protein FA95DRAFT_246762 [Auriscalpium vulgare]